uniref:Uncharacterized protein n=1 Tax=Rhizophora mucronata TaxID=61149 RepID=A0A2P2R1R7_RHIMU
MSLNYMQLSFFCFCGLTKLLFLHYVFMTNV